MSDVEEFCHYPIYSDDGWSRPCSLPIEDGHCCGYGEEHDPEPDPVWLTLMREREGWKS